MGRGQRPGWPEPPRRALSRPVASGTPAVAWRSSGCPDGAGQYGQGDQQGGETRRRGEGEGSGPAGGDPHAGARPGSERCAQDAAQRLPPAAQSEGSGGQHGTEVARGQQRGYSDCINPLVGGVWDSLNMTLRGNYSQQRCPNTHGRCLMGGARVIRTNRVLPPDPNGCRWCGDARGHHGTQWVASVGQHTWAEPTTEQRLRRMQARRAARQAASAAVTTDAAPRSGRG